MLLLIILYTVTTLGIFMINLTDTSVPMSVIVPRTLLWPVVALLWLSISLWNYFKMIVDGKF